ncbi:MAG: LLM class F420-dependent oxidoreductase [Acidimicrobiaceae bacterium]|nr:LLM class F420-dependent oxidoreductase [Acidimicrobiaceae bacterium]|tara:strand:- start:336 stop:1238 length:903 start_codon:yes stop_codon:yes gene_type:complete
MKIRIGFGLGTRSRVNNPETLGQLATSLEEHGFDSLWFSERVSGTGLDPLVAMSWIAAITEQLKFGPSVMVLPGRNPVVLAKSFASLDRISNGRVLPAFGLGAINLGEHQAFGVERKDRSPWFDEALPLMRRLWEEDVISHNGPRFQLQDVRVKPKPIQKPLDIWLGGIAPSELKRVGRLGDGWLPSFCTANDVEEAIPQIDGYSKESGRETIDREHFGALLVYTTDGSLPDEIIRAVQSRRPSVKANEIIVQGREKLSSRIKEFIDAGASKFVLMPYVEPNDWDTELRWLAEETLHLQN